MFLPYVLQRRKRRYPLTEMDLRTEEGVPPCSTEVQSPLRMNGGDSRATAVGAASGDEEFERKVRPLHGLIHRHLLIGNGVFRCPQEPPVGTVISGQEIHSVFVCFGNTWGGIESKWVYLISESDA